MPLIFNKHQRHSQAPQHQTAHHTPDRPASAAAYRHGAPSSTTSFGSTHSQPRRPPSRFEAKHGPIENISHFQAFPQCRRHWRFHCSAHRDQKAFSGPHWTSQTGQPKGQTIDKFAEEARGHGAKVFPGKLFSICGLDLGIKKELLG